jgi:hypothetical protein
MTEVVVTGVAFFILSILYYLRRGDVCLVPGLVLSVIFPFIVYTLEHRLNGSVWNDEWRKFKKPEKPVDQVIEGLLEEEGLAFERKGPWKPVRSFKFEFIERFHVEDGTRISYRGEWEHHVYVGPTDKAAEVERLKVLIDGALEPFK